MIARLDGDAEIPLFATLATGDDAHAIVKMRRGGDWIAVGKLSAGGKYTATPITADERRELGFTQASSLKPQA